MNKILKLTLAFLLLFQVSAYAFDVPTEAYTSDANTVLLAHGDGTQGAQVFPDSGNTNHGNADVSGNTNTETTDPKFGTAAIEYDGTGDYISWADHADWHLAADNWTLELQMNIPDDSKTGYDLIAQDGEAGGGRGWRLYYNGAASDGIFFDCSTNGTDAVDRKFAFVLPAENTWYWVVVRRDGNDLEAFVDGTQIGSTLSLAGVTIFDPGSPLFVGAQNNGNSTTPACRHDEVRISDVARPFAPADTGDMMSVLFVKNYINSLNPDLIGNPTWTIKAKIRMWWKNLSWDLRTKEAYASPLKITYKNESVIVDSPIIDEICNDSKFIRLVKEAVDIINREHDLKKLIELGTRGLKLLWEKSLSQ